MAQHEKGGELPPVRADLPQLFGEITEKDGKLYWADERKHMVLIEVPSELWNAFRAKRIYCNRVMAGPLTRALNNIVDRDYIHLVEGYGGCFEIRQSRGDSRLSVHARGLAVDINPKGNGLGEKPEIHPDLVECFTDEGFIWGGDWRRPDGMHFQWCREDACFAI